MSLMLAPVAEPSRRPTQGTGGASVPPVRVREATPRELLNWDGLIQRFPGWRVPHTRGWIESLQASGHGRPLYLVFEHLGEIVGCIPGLLTRVAWWRLFGSPLPGWQTVSMGPLFDPGRCSSESLVGALREYLVTRHRVDHVELMTGALDPSAMERLGFSGERIATYRAVLFPGDEARAFQALKDSARRNVRRAARLGLVCRYEDDESFVNEHYDQLREVYRRGGAAVPFSRGRLLYAFRYLRAAGQLVAISVRLPDATPIATGTFLLGPRELLLWMWAHRPAYRWYRPTELMTWTVMRRAMAAGCVSFDLMGRGSFKENFGAVLDLSKTRWVWSDGAGLARLRRWAEPGYRLQQSIRGRLARLAYLVAQA